MRSRLDEDITRRPDPATPPLPLVSLPLLAAALLLALGWAVFSPSGDPSVRQAQAQTAEPENGDSGGGPAADEEFSYAAFGEPRNPFASVVQPKTEGGLQPEGGGSGSDGSNGGGTSNDEMNALEQPARNDTTQNQNSSTPDEDSRQRADDGVQRDNSALAPPASGGAAAGSGSGNVNCQNPADDFEELLCEEDAPGSSGDGTSSARPGGIEGDRYGGSGRSGAGEPTDTFRNGGPAPTTLTK